jgi:hypothetical protein
MASDAIDSALMSYLAGDATLSGILTGGIHDFYELMTGGTESITPPYGLVILFTGKDSREFRRRAWEECRYIILVQGAPATTITTIRQACARIDTLLEGGTFSISGYTLLKSERERRFAGIVQLDEYDSGEFFFGAGYGGLYQIWAQAN